jgi:methionyl-tRNA synthetase
VGGEKMAKSKGTFVKAATYAEHLDPSYFRYYLASKLGSRLDDIDLSLDEFTAKVNADLVGKFVNLASRTAKFANKTGLSSVYPDDGGLFERAARTGEEIAAAYENCEYGRAMRLIMELADQANPYVESHEPWKLNKHPDRQDDLRDVCTVALNLFRQLAIYLAPVLPQVAEKTSELLGDPIVTWDQSKTPLVGKPVNKFKHMLQRVEAKDVDAMIEASKAPDDTAIAQEDSEQPLIDEPLAAEIVIDDFAKVDLRVARVLNAEDVPKARKLLKLTLGLGGTETRTVFAGIKEAYDPQDLVGRKVVMVANLAPRKMKFGVSEGMVVASGPGGKDVFLLGVDDGSLPGQRVH